MVHFDWLFHCVSSANVRDFSIHGVLLITEHREPGLTDWNATLWVFRVTQNKNNGVFHLGPTVL